MSLGHLNTLTLKPRGTHTLGEIRYLSLFLPRSFLERSPRCCSPASSLQSLSRRRGLLPSLPLLSSPLHHLSEVRSLIQMIFADSYLNKNNSTARHLHLMDLCRMLRLSGINPLFPPLSHPSFETELQAFPDAMGDSELSLLQIPVGQRAKPT